MCLFLTEMFQEEIISEDENEDGVNKVVIKHIKILHGVAINNLSYCMVFSITFYLSLALIYKIC